MVSKFSNRILNFSERCFRKFCSNISSFYVKSIICKIKGIQIGYGNKFYGIPYLHISNGGSIKMGNNNRFNSSPTSNKIGLHHKCMISATPGRQDTCEIEIGNNCGFSGTSIWCFCHIKLGNNVRCGANTLIMDGDAHYEDIRTPSPLPITICDNVWLGTNVVVMKGVIIGENTIIGANSIVTHDIPANCIAAGNPCRIIKFFE